MTDFERLERTTDVIARHPYYPGKPDVVQECLGDIENRCRRGLLSGEQRTRLLAILLAPGGRSGLGSHSIR